MTSLANVLKVVENNISFHTDLCYGFYLSSDIEVAVSEIEKLAKEKAAENPGIYLSTIMFCLDDVLLTYHSSVPLSVLQRAKAYLSIITALINLPSSNYMWCAAQRELLENAILKESA